MSIYETLNERANTHGDFYKGAETFSDLFDLLVKNKSNLNKHQLYAMNMILSKVVRILNGNADEVDHWKDIAGYATLGSKEVVTVKKDDKDWESVYKQIGTGA